MTDTVSRVGVEFTENGSERVLRSMNDLAGSGAKTEKVLNDVADAEKRLAAEAQRAASQSKALQLAGLNLSRQFSDVGVSLAGGINPMMVLIQQGPQIADAFQMAKSQGLGLSAVIKGLAASIAPLLPLLAAGAAAAGVIGGAFFLWKKQTDDVKAATEGAKKAAEDFAKLQTSVGAAMSKAIEFTDKYKVSNNGLSVALDKVLMAQDSTYAATLRSVDANSAAGRAAAQRAEQEKLLTVALLRQQAVEAQKRASEAQAVAKKATSAARGSALFAGIGLADDPNALATMAQIQTDRFKQLGGGKAQDLAKQENEFAKALNASADALMKQSLIVPKSAEDRRAAAAATRDAAKAEKERAAALEELRKQAQGIIQALETPYEKAIREASEQTVILRKALEAGVITADQFREAVERMFKPVVSAKDALKAMNAEFTSTPADLAKGIKSLDTARDKAIDLARAFRDVTGSLGDMVRSIKSGDLGSLILNIQDIGSGVGTLLQGGAQGVLSLGSVAANAIGGRTGRAVGTSLGIAASGIGLGTAAAAGGLGALGAGATAAIATFAAPVAIAAAALYAAAKIFQIGGKPSNNGAGFDLTTGALSGNKRTSETEQAAKGAGEAISAIQDALKAAGIGLTDSVKGLVIGTRDQTQIYLASGKTLLSAVGDSGAAVDTALKALLDGAKYVSEAQKTLVQSALAAGKGFDAIQEILSKYEAAQAISGNLADQILQLKDPKAFDLKGVEKNIASQRDAAKQLATDGYITADVLASINEQLDTLRGLQIDAVMKRYGEAVTDATNVANDNLAAANDAVSAAQEDLISAYGRQADVLKETVDRFRALSASLRQYGETLAGGPGGRPTLASARANFLRTSALAQTGDAGALGSLQQVSEAYRQAALSTAPDARTAARVLAEIRNAVEASATVADAQASSAELQLQALHDQIAALVKIDEDVLTVAQAIDNLAGALSAQAAASKAVEDLKGGASTTTTVSAPTSAPLPVDTVALEAKIVVLTDKVVTLTEQNAALLTELNKTNATTANTLVRVTQDGDALLTVAA